MAGEIFNIPLKTIAGVETTLEPYRGQVILIVNTASECGFTPQYQGLQEIYEHFKGQGFVVLGFPCNQFGAQEPGSESEIANFCQKNYGVTFPLFAKLEVNGKNTHPLFEHLKTAAPGILGSEGIKWNFTKFLISRSGEVLNRFAPSTAPTALVDEIEKALS